MDKLLIKEELQLQLTSASAESWWHELTIHPGLPQEEVGDDDNKADDMLTMVMMMTRVDHPGVA